MNEKTKEIAEQAGFGYDDLEVDRTMIMIIERFAELIRSDERENLRVMVFNLERELEEAQEQWNSCLIREQFRARDMK